MSSTPEQQDGRYQPTPPGELLERAKRRSAALRKRRLTAIGGSVCVVVALVLGAVISTGQPSRRPGRVVVAARIGGAYELTANESPAAAAPAGVVRGVESAEVGFSLGVLSRLVGSSDLDNQLVSPSSLATALAMLQLGAGGSTEKAIAATLRSSELSAEEQAAGWHSLSAILDSETSRLGSNPAHVPELDVANALWLQQSFSVLPAFVRSLSADFRTGMWQANFQSDLPGALHAINEWTSEHTKGLIKQLFRPGSLDRSTVLVLADAVYFKALWAYRFASATKNRAFHLTGGRSESVPFMSSRTSDSPTFKVSSTPQYLAVELPYAGKKISALVVMPQHSSLSSFLSSLSPGSFARIVRGLSPEAAELSMPTFTLRSDNDLIPVLSAMGMSVAFGDSADFTGITTGTSLYVKAVVQRAYLQVTPKGTTAAAVTGIGVVSSAARVIPRLAVDHPFLFLVRDDVTGAILFESAVENPAG